MGEFKVAIGAKFDVATEQEVAKHCLNLQGHFDKKLSEMRSRVAPIRRTIAASVVIPTIPTGATFVLPFVPERPSLGRTWNLTRFTVTGGDDNTSIPNYKAALYVGDTQAPNLTQVIIPGVAFPYFTTFNLANVWVHDTESIFVNFTCTNSLAPQTVVISASLNEYEGVVAEAGMI